MKTQLISFAVACVASVSGYDFLDTLINVTNEAQTNNSVVEGLGQLNNLLTVGALGGQHIDLETLGQL
jgi:hypothetical protein